MRKAARFERSVLKGPEISRRHWKAFLHLRGEENDPTIHALERLLDLRLRSDFAVEVSQFSFGRPRLGDPEAAG